jgi:glycosyltransferase involved in cell wall biosynthesis
MPEDRLAAALVDHPRVRHLLVCDPMRSAPRKLARAVLGPRDQPFPSSPTARHYSPVRLRRDDPVDRRALQRSYRSYEENIRAEAKRAGIRDPAVITTNPILAGLGNFGWAGPVTYYGWDDWTAYEPMRRWWPAYEDAFARLRDKHRRVVAVSTTIADRIGPTGRFAIVPNGVDPAEWERLPPPPDWLLDRATPRLLYVGSLQSRVDVQQIREVAEAFPSASITLVGPLLEPSHFASLRGVPNVEFFPRVSREVVPGLIAGADVGLIPHVQSSLTEAMSPLKLYEYLAGGLPVAAVDLPGIVGVSDRTFVVPPGGDMAGAVTRALAAGRASETDRLAFVRANSWAQRFQTLLDIALAPA